MCQINKDKHFFSFFFFVFRFCTGLKFLCIIWCNLKYFSLYYFSKGLGSLSLMLCHSLFQHLGEFVLWIFKLKFFEVYFFLIIMVVQTAIAISLFWCLPCYRHPYLYLWFCLCVLTLKKTPTSVVLLTLFWAMLQYIVWLIKKPQKTITL